jgi:LacI family transcriptional regulator
MRKRAQHPRVLLLIDTAGAVGRDLVMGISRYSAENGPWTIQFEYRTLDSMPPKWLRQWRGDGIISRTINARQERVLKAAKLPLVELLGHPETGGYRVRTDFAAEARMVVEHFVGCGLRHFAYFSLGESWWIKGLRETYCQVLAERGAESCTYRVPTALAKMPLWHEKQRPELANWIASLPRPIGVFTPGDMHSVRLLDICHEMNVAVPEELSILGRGNDPVICGAARPTLSSVDLDARRVGFEAARLLDHMMAGKSGDECVDIPPSRIVVRQSTDLVAIEDPDVAQAVRIIRESACGDLNVSDIAEDVGISRRVLESRFLKHLGRSPKSEIMRVRIETAKRLLAQTDKSSESIARKCGFCSREYFTRVFRDKVGMTLEAYRRMQRISRDVDDREAP